MRETSLQYSLIVNVIVRVGKGQELFKVNPIGKMNDRDLTKDNIPNGVYPVRTSGLSSPYS